MIGGAWYLGYVFDGPFSFALLYLIVPVATILWWGSQIWDAYCDTAGGSLFPVFPLPSRGSLDIQAIGFLFLIAVYSDLYIIQARPDYELKILGSTLPGEWGILAKAQSPILHALIGVGLLRLRRWGLLVYLVYAVWGTVNALVNLSVLPGPHRIRIIFIFSLAAFTAYLWWRRDRLAPQSRALR